MSSQTLDLIMLSNVPLDTPIVSGGVDVTHWDKFSIQGVLSFAGGDTTTGEIDFQHSNNNVDWIGFGSSPLFYPTTTTVFTETSTPSMPKYIRVKVVPYGGTGGLVTFYLHLIKT